MRRLLPLGLLTVLLAACGGGGGKPLSHEEFVKQANAICADYNNRIVALGTPQSLGDLAAFAQKGRTISEDEVGRFAKLKPPPKDAAGAAAFVAAGRTVIDDLGKLEAAAKKGSVSAVQQLAATAQTNADKARLVAQRLGLAECVRQTG